MKKIGRNDPCHCGSGKKYKRCCLGKDELEQSISSNREKENNPSNAINNEQTLDHLKTSELIHVLKEYGIPFHKKKFSEEVKACYSAEELVEHWVHQHGLRLVGEKLATIHEATVVLWKRLGGKQYMSGEEMAELYEQGANMSEQNDFIGASDLWLSIWNALKSRHDQRYKDLSLLEETYAPFFFVSNFVQDLENELHNAGMQERKYFYKRIKYCQEFCDRFSEEDELIVHNMRRAIADSYSFLGEYDSAEAEYEKIALDFPDNHWSYIGWGDMYYLHKKENVKRAKQLYEKALSIAKDESERLDVLDRLNGM